MSNAGAGRLLLLPEQYEGSVMLEHVKPGAPKLVLKTCAWALDVASSDVAPTAHIVKMRRMCLRLDAAIFAPSILVLQFGQRQTVMHFSGRN